MDNSWCPSFSQNPKPKSTIHHNTLKKVKGRSKKWTILGAQVFHKTLKPKSTNHHNTLKKVKGRCKKWTILGAQVFHKSLNPNPQIIIIPCKTHCLLGQCKTMLCVCESRVNVNDLYLHIRTFYTYIISKYNFFFAMDHLVRLSSKT